MQRKFRLAAIEFTHFHMGDNLRMAFEHPDVEVVGICDERPELLADAIRTWGIPPNQVFHDYRTCLEKTCPDVVLLCPATADHAMWVKRVAEMGVHVLLEKPFADSLAGADAMIAAMQASARQLAINWPMVWYPAHRTAKRLIDAGEIGQVREVHYYDGNRGPLWHGAHKVPKTAADVAREKPHSWFYQRQFGGGSLLDYLGYGTTLGTWFLQGAIPTHVTCCTYAEPGLEVDEQSVSVVRYATGLSTFQTRWGTFTDPWTHQPQPKCGFVLVGEAGTISSYDGEPTVTLQTRQQPAGTAIPVDALAPPHQNPVQYFLHALARDEPVSGPLSPAVSRIGQQIVDAALRSLDQQGTVTL